jgi:hypothetical protein
MAKAQAAPIAFLFVGTPLEQVVGILIKEVIAKSGNNYYSDYLTMGNLKVVGPIKKTLINRDF